MDRRTFVGAIGAAALAGFAGCSSGARAASGPPTVPADALESGGWEQVGADTQDPAFERSVGPVTVTATTVTRVYEDAALRATVRDRTLGQVDARLASFFASRVSFDPDLASLPAGVGRAELLDRIETQASNAFEGRLRSAGLTEIERAGSGSLDVESGAEARRLDYEAAYAFDGFSFPLSAEKKLTVGGGSLSVAGHLATWYANGSVLVAGGAYPAENFAQTVEKSPTEAIDVAVDIDLGLEPERYRTELMDLVRQVE